MKHSKPAIIVLACIGILFTFFPAHTSPLWINLFVFMPIALAFGYGANPIQKKAALQAIPVKGNQQDIRKGR